MAPVMPWVAGPWTKSLKNTVVKNDIFFSKNLTADKKWQ